MKLIIVPLLFLFISFNVFAQDTQSSVREAQSQKQQELLNKQEEEKTKAEEKELEKKQKAELKELEKKQAKEKKEQEKLLKQQQEQQKKQEKEEKAEQELSKIREEKKRKADDIQKKKDASREAKEKRKQEKEEIRKLRLQKKQEARARRFERDTPSSSLVLDYDLRFRAASYSNLDYTAEKAEGADIYRQYLGINIIGKFDDRIEMSAKLASYGMSGKRSEAFIMPHAQEDFSFFLESAFLSFKSDIYALIPYVLTFGKQYLTAGDGLIIDSNQNGFLGARVNADLTRMFSVDAFAAKVDNQDFNIYAGIIKIKTAPAVEIGIFQERNNTGFAYQKGVLIDSPSYAIESDIKIFYNIRVTGGNQKYGYRLEAAQQTGELVRSSTDTVDYDALAFVAEGSWTGTLLKKDSNAKVVFAYADAEDENAFNPTFSRRYDGLSRVGYGTLFAANAGDSFLILPDGYRGINTIGAGVNTAPWKFLRLGLAFYLFSASDAPADAGDAGFAKLFGAEADLGNEVDFFVKYKYFDYFDVGLGIAVYTPPSNAEKVFSNTETSYLYQIEVNAKF